MFDWQELTLFLYILARISGFILFNPILNRSNAPGLFRAGFILVLSVFVSSTVTQTVPVPVGIMEFAIRILLELLLGFVLGVIVNFFLYIPQLAGQMIDTQMGMTMNQIYDAASHASLSVTATFLNALMILLFFAANGHHTMFRIVLTSGTIIPFGAVSFDISLLVNALLELFAECTVLAIKLCLPILGVELLGQLGMGILMKAIPQINVFSINLELKILIGLIFLLLLIAPVSEFLLQAEMTMLNSLERVLHLAGS